MSTRHGAGLSSLFRTALTVLVTAALGLGGAVAVLVVTESAAGAQSRAGAVQSAAAYAHNRGYHIGIAVLDTATGRTYSAGTASSTFASESVVKAFIATRLLVSGRMHGSTASRAYKMVTQSDDAIASSLYGSVGGDSLINWVKAYYHLPNLGSPPRRSGWWGNTHITANGLVQFYAKVKRDRRVAPWLLNAMHHATQYGSDGTYQWFGLHSATSGAAIKQGWGADYDDWSNSADFNSTGFVGHDRYAVALLARGPLSTYGAEISSMLTHVARLVLPNGAFPDDSAAVTSLSQHSASTLGGTRISVHGANFTGVTAVTFGGVRVRWIRVLTTHTISVPAPAHAPGAVYVRVFTSHGNSGLHDGRFIYVSPPVVSAVSPASGQLAGGQVVAVTGHDFTHVRQVMFGTAAGTRPHVISSTLLRVLSPAHVAGPVNVRVLTNYGRSRPVVVDAFTYGATPTVTSVTPNKGPVAGKITVTVTGTGFAGATAVTFGNARATSVTVASDGKSLTAVSPAHAAGAVNVHVQNAFGTSGAVFADRFTFVAASAAPPAAPTPTASTSGAPGPAASRSTAPGSAASGGS